MRPLRVAPAHEAVRLAHTDLPSSVERMRDWLLLGANLRSYDPARAMSKRAIEHSVELPWMLRQCDLIRPDINREPNKQLIRSLWDLGGSVKWRCYDPVPLPWSFRADLALQVASDLQIVEAGRPFALWMQPRIGKTAPTPTQLGMLARIFLMSGKELGYEELRLYVADMRHIEGDKRTLVLWSLDDLPVATEKDASQTLQLFADAYDSLSREGFDPAAIKKRRREAREAAARAAGRATSGDLFT